MFYLQSSPGHVCFNTRDLENVPRSHTNVLDTVLIGNKRAELISYVYGSMIRYHSTYYYCHYVLQRFRISTFLLYLLLRRQH